MADTDLLLTDGTSLLLLVNGTGTDHLILATSVDTIPPSGVAGGGGSATTTIPHSPTLALPRLDAAPHVTRRGRALVSLAALADTPAVSYTERHRAVLTLRNNTPTPTPGYHVQETAPVALTAVDTRPGASSRDNAGIAREDDELLMLLDLI